ncbi:Vacuolar protein sorting-associated protein 17 [Tulasnella sp. JGI-2019a]|nr:Vacuolar protein sorting-associated protein 17 [Tulasnella sp. JGI-2019a]KAG9000186.1 Vacuolar protein sorting-associated protein 17 [Tulasnella sp. JGI-2019a]KAG9027152.1 Vacuolar protein sorting-associated protein 17 [Tulasnella sp. JGI-2019a]
MYDPLNEGFATSTSSSNSTLGWPSTPHNPFADGAILPRPSTPKPQPPNPNDKPALQQPPLSPFGKEPQIYGQPSPGLVSPNNNGNTKHEKTEPYLRVRITGLDRNRRDILVRLDAQTNLPNFTGTTYRNISRSYVEFQRFAEQITYSNPQTIVPALPLPQTSAPTDEEDDRLVRVTLQRWFSRVCEDPILIRDEEVRSFIESDFGYQPTVRPKRKTSSGFNLLKRGAPDEDEELIAARLELTRLEGEFFDAAKGVDKLSRARKALSAAHAEMGNRLINVATTEAHPPLAVALRKFGRTWHSVGDLDQAQAVSETVILGDSLGYQGINAKAAKETLQQRTQVLEEYQTAVKTSISKRRNIERLKASNNIRPERVDEALEDMEEAARSEQLLAKRVDGISQNLHKALHTHSRHTHEDIAHSLIEHARTVILYEKQLLKELESLKTDFANINKRTVDVATKVPTMSPQQSHLPTSSSGPNIAAKSDLRGEARIRADSFGGAPIVTANGSIIAPTGSGSFGARMDGTQSMFISPATMAAQHPLPASPSPNVQGQQIPPSPAVGRGGPGLVAQRAVAGGSNPSSPLSPAYHQQQSVDPLGAAGNPRAPGDDSIHGQGPMIGRGSMGPHGASAMARSMYVQPARSRLDAREAAAKLANFL